MTIGIDISPVKTGHKFRGTGSYTENLVKSLEKYDKKNKYKFFTREERIPADLDLIHYPYFEPFFLTFPLKKSTPTVVTVHDLTPLVFPKHFPRGLEGELKWWIQRWSLKGAKAVITDSECSKKDLMKIAEVEERKIFVIYLASDERFKKLVKDDERRIIVKNKYHLPEKFVLYVGDATWNKNVPGLIKATKKIDVPLVLVGKQLADPNFDRSNPWNKDLIEVENLTEDDHKIYKLGFLPFEELVAIYNLATLCVQPSFYEGFGLPVLEAMACGCPVVTSNVSSLPEVAGKAAYYVDPEKVEDMAKGIKELYYSSQLREKLQKAGLLQAAKFSWEKTTQETISVYQKFLSS